MKILAEFESGLNAQELQASYAAAGAESRVGTNAQFSPLFLLRWAFRWRSRRGQGGGSCRAAGHELLEFLPDEIEK